MIIKHLGKTPTIDQSSFIAPNTMIWGDVKIGKNVRVMFGAQIIAESSPAGMDLQSIPIKKRIKIKGS